MERWLGRWSEQIYALFRIVVGALFLPHGLQKLFGMFGGMRGTGATAEAGTQTWFGGLIELVCGALVMLGLQAGWAAFLASGTMAVAYWQFHHSAEKPLPIQNQGELACLYCFAFLLIAAKGSGMWSIDRLLRRRA